ncbi:erythropoietin-like isoform X1 [Scleropages formosus]|uniref:erythropoietin-like isoform X1 n=1 Tax=Scleropages formosus TaxID=113540 RepID=UPI000877FE09|nr:erythropoietin isoform X1 [Scleropages formosus]
MQTYVVIGLVAVLLIVLEWTRSGMPSVLKPVCDPRVLDRFIREAQDTEVAMQACRRECALSLSLTVPLTSVDFVAWDKKNVQEQAQEVQSGLWLLGKAIDVVRASVSNTALQSMLDNSYSNIHSIRQVIRTLNIQDWSPSPTESASLDTRQVSSTPELFRVQTNFLRGKVRLLLSHAPACHRSSS